MIQFIPYQTNNNTIFSEEKTSKQFQNFVDQIHTYINKKYSEDCSFGLLNELILNLFYEIFDINCKIQNFVSIQPQLKKNTLKKGNLEKEKESTKLSNIMNTIVVPKLPPFDFINTKPISFNDKQFWRITTYLYEGRDIVIHTLTGIAIEILDENIKLFGMKVDGKLIPVEKVDKTICDWVYKCGIPI